MHLFSCGDGKTAVVHRTTLRTLLGLASASAPTSTLGEKTAARRLGKAELGPHAYEERMPAKFRVQLENDSATTRAEADGVIQALGRLCAQDISVEAVYLCHPAVRCISKTKKEGNLCGYRNIQMMISYIHGAKAQGFERFSDGLPSVLELQDLIEEAWDKGINSDGRVETGGIRGTRKYIGTPEAQALFRSLSIGCRAGAYRGTAAQGSACAELLEHVKQYFISSSPNAATPSKVHQTNLPPIYLQRPGHSLTIVGFEAQLDGTSNLLVFDPASRLPPSVAKAVGCPEGDIVITVKSREVEALLKPFRRGKRQLQRYTAFETLLLTEYAPNCQCSTQDV